MQIRQNRGRLVRAVGVLCIALVCAMGMVQAIHAHPEDSATSHHTCSICATAHAGVTTQVAASAPVLATTTFTSLPAEICLIFRPAATQFIRPPPAL
jgi:hypothetical protein